MLVFGWSSENEVVGLPNIEREYQCKIIPIRLATKGLLVLEVGQLDWPHTGSLQVRTDLVQKPHCLWAAFLWHFIPWQNRFLDPWSYRTP